MKKNNYITINNRKIGLDFIPVVIAEIGINHEGSLQAAFEMVDAAWKAVIFNIIFMRY